jgi:glutathione S-transferase
VYELITIAFSHYCEKARWALDRAGVPYRERRFMPAFHLPSVALALVGTGRGRPDRVSTRFSTPVLRGPDVLLTDSSEIVRWADEHHGREGLYASPEATALETHFGTALGPHTRRVVYWFALRDPTLMVEMAKDNVGSVQAGLFALARPFVGLLVGRKLRVHEAGYRRSLESVETVLGEVDARLSDGRRYLLGDRFSAADLSFAALLAPVVLPGPDQFGAVLPKIDRLAPEMQDWITRLRERPAGRFASRMFAEERRKPVAG